MSIEVYVVYRYRDYRKENDAEIIAVCKSQDNALKMMKEAIEKFTEDWDDDDGIEWFNNGANVMSGSDCNVFIIDKKNLLD